MPPKFYDATDKDIGRTAGSFMKKSDTLALALTTVLFCGLAALIWFDRPPTNAQLSSPTNDEPPLAATHQVPPPGHESPTMAPAAPIYKCLRNGSAFYQDIPCPEGPATPMTNGTLSVVSPPRLNLEHAATTGAPRVALVRTPSVTGEHDECSHLRRKIKGIDAEARIRSTAHLTTSRRATRDRMFTLKCREID